MLKKLNDQLTRNTRTDEVITSLTCRLIDNLLFTENEHSDTEKVEPPDGWWVS
jgi:hypothetical protein